MACYLNWGHLKMWFLDVSGIWVSHMQIDTVLKKLSLRTAYLPGLEGCCCWFSKSGNFSLSTSGLRLGVRSLLLDRSRAGPGDVGWERCLEPEDRSLGGGDRCG